MVIEANWLDLEQKLALLLATAAVSGFLVPYILKTVESQKARREKERDAELTRQGKIIEAEVAFLDRLTDKLWAWRYLAIRLTYYGVYGPSDKYEGSKEIYSDQFWESLNGLRVELSKANRLVSVPLNNRLNRFYSVVIDCDKEIRHASEEPLQSAREAMYADLNNRIFSEISCEIDALLSAVATELSLSST